jgi:hypothetical protein
MFSPFHSFAGPRHSVCCVQPVIRALCAYRQAAGAPLQLSGEIDLLSATLQPIEMQSHTLRKYRDDTFVKCVCLFSNDV